jgi:hypothetical protein
MMYSIAISWKKPVASLTTYCPRVCSVSSTGASADPEDIGSEVRETFLAAAGLALDCDGGVIGNYARIKSCLFVRRNDLVS